MSKEKVGLGVSKQTGGRADMGKALRKEWSLPSLPLRSRPSPKIALAKSDQKYSMDTSQEGINQITHVRSHKKVLHSQSHK